MRKMIPLTVILLVSLISGLPSNIPSVTASLPSKPLQAVSEPQLKWAYGGCVSGYCQTGWYSSPAIADLDGDGQAEVIGAAYSIFVLNGATGATEMTLRGQTLP